MSSRVTLNRANRSLTIFPGSRPVLSASLTNRGGRWGVGGDHGRQATVVRRLAASLDPTRPVSIWVPIFQTNPRQVDESAKHFTGA